MNFISTAGDFTDLEGDRAEEGESGDRFGCSGGSFSLFDLRNLKLDDLLLLLFDDRDFDNKLRNDDVAFVEDFIFSFVSVLIHRESEMMR